MFVFVKKKGYEKCPDIRTKFNGLFWERPFWK